MVGKGEGQGERAGERGRPCLPIAEFAAFTKFSFVAFSITFLPIVELITFLAKAEFATFVNMSMIPAPCVLGLITSMIILYRHNYTPPD